MRHVPLPRAEAERLAALRNALCAYVPHEERFDRLTRTLRRLTHTPIALVSIVEQDQLWFRSVQGLQVAHTPRDISFCAHVVATGEPFIINDTHTHADFRNNPLVTGEPGIRSYVGWPLEIEPGLVAGALCAIDTVPRVFSSDELAGLKDLARAAQSELRARPAPGLARLALQGMDPDQRRDALDPVTGCWNEAAFELVVTSALAQARAEGHALALCRLSLLNLGSATRALDEEGRALVLSVAAQLLREVLPEDGALARLPIGFGALVTAETPQALERRLEPLLRQDELQIVMSGRPPVHLALRAAVVRLDGAQEGAAAGQVLPSRPDTGTHG